MSREFLHSMLPPSELPLNPRCPSFASDRCHGGEDAVCSLHFGGPASSNSSKNVTNCFGFLSALLQRAHSEGSHLLNSVCRRLDVQFTCTAPASAHRMTSSQSVTAPAPFLMTALVETMFEEAFLVDGHRQSRCPTASVLLTCAVLLDGSLRRSNVRGKDFLLMVVRLPLSLDTKAEHALSAAIYQ